MLRSLIAVVTAGALVGCGAEWPNRATVVADRGFMAKPKVTSVDILPIDLEMWAAPGAGDDLEQTRSSAEAQIANLALTTLSQRQYSVSSMIQWDGSTGWGTAMAQDDVMATVSALAGYGAKADKTPGLLPTPYLPSRLGTASGADATLFIGGWSFVGASEESTADKIAKGVAIALVVIAVVVIIAAIASAADHKGSHGHSHSSGGGGGGGPVFASHHASHVAAHLAVNALDAFGRVAEAAAETDWSSDPNLPHDGDSQMYLEMTLVDNHTGLVLWHVHQQFPASAQSQGDVGRVARTLLASLPAH